jgi:hypothetical protein
MSSWKKILATFAVLALCVPFIGTTGAQAASVHNRVLELRDNCDPVTWGAEFPGLCAVKPDGIPGTVTLAKFRADLAKGGSGAWWIRQRDITLDKGDTIAATDVGGIIHSFTEVAQFGKGCVADWNVAVRETVDNCDFGKFVTTLVPSGTTSAAQTLSTGVHKFQCLIHPWMRTVVTVRS